MNGDKSCCVCLNTSVSLNKISRKDENKINLLTQLNTAVPEVEWHHSYEICDPCSNLLGIVYNFRETCVKSDALRKHQKEEEEEEKTCLCDLKREECITHDQLKSEINNNFEIKNDNENWIECMEYLEEKNVPDVIDSYQPTKTKRKVSQFHCEICENIFVSRKKLIDHCVEEHQMNSKDVKPFVCDRCPSRFGNSYSLLQHLKYHEAIRSNMCTYCGKNFITKTDLNTHEKQHLNKRDYKCESCGKCFNTHKAIWSHKLLIHTDRNMWKHHCAICNKRFAIKSNYDGHMRRHTGDKKFECHLCSKKFTDNRALQVHIRTHSNVREFQCTVCSKEYKEKRVMQIHMAKVHGIGIGDIKLPPPRKNSDATVRGTPLKNPPIKNCSNTT